MENKNYTEQELNDLMDELEKMSEASGFKWPVYHENGLVTVSSNEFVCVMNANNFNKLMSEAAQDYIKKLGDEI